MSVEVVPDQIMAYTTVGLGEHMFIWKQVLTLSSSDGRKENLDHSCLSIFLFADK